MEEGLHLDVSIGKQTGMMIWSMLCCRNCCHLWTEYTHLVPTLIVARV